MHVSVRVWCLRSALWNARCVQGGVPDVASRARQTRDAQTRSMNAAAKPRGLCVRSELKMYRRLCAAATGT